MDEREFLRKLRTFLAWSGDYYEVIDEDGLRKPAITIRKADHLCGKNCQTEFYTIRIDWQLLGKWLEG